MRTLYSGWFLISVVLVMMSPAVARADAWQGTEDIRDGVLHVLNPSTPLQPAQTIKPREMFRLGGDSDDDNEMFGRIIETKVDSAGVSYLLDVQLAEVKAFDAQGNYLRTYGRNGQGPGEYSYPMRLFFLPGDRLAVCNLMPSRVPVRDLKTGHARDDVSLPYHDGERPMFVSVMDAWGDFIVLGYVHAHHLEGREANTRILASFREGDDEVTLIDKRSVFLSENPPEHKRESFYADWEISANGIIYVAPYYLKYQIYGFNPDGSVRHVIERDYETLKRTKSEMKTLNAAHDAQFGNMQGVQRPTEYHRHIRGIYPQENGTLWVLTERGVKAADGQGLGYFDVFDADGRFLRQVKLDVNFDERWDTFEFAGNRLYVHKEARGIPATTGSASGGMMVMIGGHEAVSTDDREAQPYELVCYELPD